ncbi:MAG: ATP-binding protein [Deferrisomatales bacterium]
MRLTLFPKLLLAFLALSLPGLLWLSLDATRRIAAVGEEAVHVSVQVLDDKAKQSLELQAFGLAEQVSRFLEERVQDLRILGELPKDPQAFLLFCRSRTGEVWTRRRDPVGGVQEYHHRLPIYSEVSWIGADGREVFRVDGDWMAPHRSLRDVSTPFRTTYGIETYFQDAVRARPGEILVGRLVGRHVGKAEQLAGAGTPEEAVGGAEYVGHVRFAKAVWEGEELRGVVALALDHRHLMEFTQHVLPLSRERVIFPSYLSGNYAFLFDDRGWIITHPKFWNLPGLDEQGRWVPAFSPSSAPEDVEAGRIPFNLDAAGFVHPNYPEVARAVRDGESGVTRTFNVAGVDKVMAYAPIYVRPGPGESPFVFGGVTIGALTEAFHREAAATGQAIEEASRETLRTGLTLAWALGLAVLGAAFWLSRAIARPVHTMAQMAGRIAGGDLSARVGAIPRDEVGHLALALNRMGELLEEKERRLGESRGELERSRDDAHAYAERLEEQLATLSHIQSISGFLGTTFDREELLQIILRTCVEGLGFDRVLLYVLDPDGERLRCVGVNGFDGAEEARVLSASFEVSRDQGVPVTVVRTGRPIHGAEGGGPTGLSRAGRGVAEGDLSPSSVYVPMKSRDAVVGVLGADSAVTGRPIPEHRVGALQIVAGQAARAIERARLYEEAQRARAFIEAVVDSLGSGLITLGARGEVLTVNRYAQTALGLEEASARGKTLEACGVDRNLPRWVASLGREGIAEAGELEVVTPLGRRTFTWVPSRFEADGGPGLILQFRDITEERDMARTLERVDRLASLGRMAASVAHEIRNPLTGVALLLDDLHDRLPVGADRALAAQALQEVERLEGIIQELLAYARVDRREHRECRLEEVLEQSLFLLKKQAHNQGVRVTFRAAPGLAGVRGDPEKLKQALLNLYLNALQAMPDGGELRVLARATEDGVEVRVEDTGPGVPPEEAERIFEPFYTLRSGGTGLGLSIAYTIVADHGGRIEVERRAGRGATFLVYLPGSRSALSEAAPGDVAVAAQERQIAP